MTSKQQEKIEARIEELKFLAEAITEQTAKIEDCQANLQIDLKQSLTDDLANDPFRLTEQLQDLLSKYHETSQQRVELSEMEADLVRREQKLRGQRNALTQRFRAERAQLQLEKLELESLKSLLGESESLPNDGETTIADEADDEQVDSQPSGKMELEMTMLKERLKASEEKNHLLLSEIDDFKGQLIKIQASQPTADSDSAQITELAELRRQLEGTKAELREARSEANRLRSSLPVSDAESTSWEEQKRLLLANLEDESETDSNAGDPRILQSLRDAEETIRQKDEIIAQLEALVKETEDQDLAERAAAAKEQCEVMFDSDEVIAQERERLKQLEQQWRKKIGEAEVELSRERARVARDRVSLDEQMHELETRLASIEDAPEKPRKRKWLDQLGLS